MAQYVGSFSSRPFNLVLDVWLVSQNQEGNYSTIAFTLTIVKTGLNYSYEYDANSSFWVNVDGQVVGGNFAYDFRNYDSLQLGVWQTTYYHDADGYKGLGSSASAASSLMGSASCSGVQWLPRIPKPPTPPGTPDVDSITGTSVRVAYWAPPASDNGAGVDLYRVHVGTNPSFPGGTYAAQDVGGAGVTFGGLALNTTYYVMVLAHNAVGWSTWGGLRAFTTLNTPSAPGTPYVVSIDPVSVTVLFNGSANNGGAAIDWYSVQLINAGYTTVLQDQHVAGGSVTFSSLMPGTSYYVRVTAHNSVGSGPQSGNLLITTLSGAKVRVAEVWVNGIAYVRSSGVWALARVYKRVSGAWVQ